MARPSLHHNFPTILLDLFPPFPFFTSTLPFFLFIYEKVTLLPIHPPRICSTPKHLHPCVCVCVCVLRMSFYSTHKVKQKHRGASPLPLPPSAFSFQLYNTFLTYSAFFGLNCDSLGIHSLFIIL